MEAFIEAAAARRRGHFAKPMEIQMDLFFAMALGSEMKS
ncbi:hypothetical protein Agau_P200328 (plasmid) [Agrobacterium tumefaciens F2]|nr:hypothetical protein Agau_P200328 [Agrobacterium tumefaciens F2]